VKGGTKPVGTGAVDPVPRMREDPNGAAPLAGRQVPSKAEGGRRKAEGGRRKAEGGRRKAEGGLDEKLDNNMM
jgi:hypothetical protein